MANNTVLNSGTGGDTIRDIDRSGVKTPVCLVDVGGAAGEALLGDANVGMPIKAIGGQAATVYVNARLTDGTNFLGTLSSLAVAGDVAAAATDSGNPVKIGAVYNTSLPTYTNGQRVNLQADSSGRLIVSATLAGQADLTPATQNITVIDSASTTAAGNAGQSIITGTPTAGSAATFTVAADGSYAIQLSGTWTGTVQFEQSIDGGVTWAPSGTFGAGQSVSQTTATLNGTFEGACSCSTSVRVRATAAMTGTVVVRLVASATTRVVKVLNGVSVRDPSSLQIATVKPASTASVAADTAFVVAPSPNSVGPTARVVGQRYVGGVLTNILDLPIDVSASGETQLVAATSGKKIVVLKWYLHAGGGANNVKVVDFDGASTRVNLLPLQTLLASQTISGADSEDGHWRSLATNHSMTINLSAATQVTGYMNYILV